jgi:MDMPI C-terminal domain
VTPVDRELAVDGIDELLYLMFAGDWTGDEQPSLTGTVAVATPERSWTIRMVDDRVDVDDGESADVAATVAAEPAPVLLWMYGRASDDVVTVSGDPAIATRLRKRLAVATQ